jgi:S-adenosylmethionine decarboxylase
MKQIQPFGQHLTIDGYGCDRETLRDISGIHQFLDRAPGEIGMTKIMPPQVVRQENGQVAGYIIIAESHISVHTFPKYLFLSLDIFSCKVFNVNDATQMAIDHFKIARMEVNLLDRGLEFRRHG